MAKKPSKQVQSIPTIYQGLSRDAGLLKVCVVEDIHGGFYLFDKPESNHILKQACQKVWPSFESFTEENKQTLLTYHENLFKAPADKDLALDEVAAWCWYKIASLAVDRTPRTATTESGRKSTILSSKYYPGENNLDPQGNEFDGDLKTPQAKACLKLFRAALKRDGITTGEPGAEVTHITEELLKKFITENAAELHTKQEPWRIFQYYRPILIAQKLLRRE